MTHVSHRLKNSFEGALAGGGDPATSPLYVFGPYLRLLAASGLGAVCFGAPIWMVVGTVLVVSLMYRHVMLWVPDGSGGSGLCEEEFGGWAVKVNASITAIEYTLTFLVSIAALVTFVADRAGGLGRPERTALAVLLAVIVGLVVNRGPRVVARVFGPATGAVLLLLWLLVGAVVLRRGLHLPAISLLAFHPDHLQTTLAGYVRLLALMTGIEVFANLVAAYDGPPEQRARKAFGSLGIIMVTTLVTMVIVGPAIHELADPMRTDVSVFTQTMDQLLPRPLAYLGTLVGIVVLLSAAAASAQGLQNLSLGLRYRHYVPARFGQRNRFDVADRPVLLQVLVVSGCFVAFGTHEETYLALYAAGVFVLLGLTGWASVKRLSRPGPTGESAHASRLGTILAAAITSGAAVLILVERFTEGAWTYAVLVPILYLVFSRYRAQFGAPNRLEERLGRVLTERKSFVAVEAPRWPQGVVAVVDGGAPAEPALLAAVTIAHAFDCPVGVCGVVFPDAAAYLNLLQRAFRFPLPIRVAGSVAEAPSIARAAGAELIVAARGLAGVRALLRASDLPVLVVTGGEVAMTRYAVPARVVLSLDGSPEAESSIPYAARLLDVGAHVSLVLVPEDEMSPATLEAYAKKVAQSLARHGTLSVAVGGSGPARTILERAREYRADLVVVASHGRGGIQRAEEVPLGSVPERLLSDLECPLLVVPALAAGSGADGLSDNSTAE